MVHFWRLFGPQISGLGGRGWERGGWEGRRERSYLLNVPLASLYNIYSTRMHVLESETVSQALMPVASMSRKSDYRVFALSM